MINLINHCKSFAVNLNHQQITENDITKGLAAFSADVLTDINLEIRDIYPNSGDVLSAFYLVHQKLSNRELYKTLEEHLSDTKILEHIIDILLWYGFIGVWESDDSIHYIYDVSYNIDLLKTIIRKKGESVVYIINPAFVSSLHLQS